MYDSNVVQVTIIIKIIQGKTLIIVFIFIHASFD